MTTNNSSLISILFPNKQLIKDAALAIDDYILLYGDISAKLIKRTLKAVGKNGKIYIIGRNKKVTDFSLFTRGKYKGQIVVNPFFENLNHLSLNKIIITNASLNLKIVLPLAQQAKNILKSQGQIIIIDDNIPPQAIEKLSINVPWFRQVKDATLLTFEKK